MIKRPAGFVCIVAMASTIRAQSATDNLRAFVTAYSHDSMQGRLIGSFAVAQLTTALRDSLIRIGLKPLGDKENYFQDVPLVRVTMTPMSMTLVGAARSGQYVYGVDFLPLPGIGGLPFARETRGDILVFGGRLGASTAIAPQKASGAVVLMQPPLRADGTPDYQLWRYPELFARYHTAKAILVNSLELMPASVRQSLNRPHFEIKKKASRDLPPIPPVVFISEAATVQLLGRTLEEAIARRDSTRAPVSLIMNLVVDDARAPTRNVVAIIQGSDPNLKSQYVVLSAKLDQADYRDRDGGMRRSWPLNADTTLNGADAVTGAASLLEIAREMMSQPAKPKRTVVFLWTVGSDDGLLGAEYFVSSSLIPRDRIVANINVDNVGRGLAADNAKETLNKSPQQ